MNLGDRMVRLEDGMAGTVEDHDGSLRIVYHDRGERYVAGKQQTWVSAGPVTNKLRVEEMREVALQADRALRAIDLHEPRRYWEPVTTIDEPHDPLLVAVIMTYLGNRG